MVYRGPVSNRRELNTYSRLRTKGDIDVIPLLNLTCKMINHLLPRIGFPYHPLLREASTDGTS